MQEPRLLRLRMSAREDVEPFLLFIKPLRHEGLEECLVGSALALATA
jgi:hypothetical protein